MSDQRQGVKGVIDAIKEAGGKVEGPVALPDGTGFFTASFPLRDDHWIYEQNNEPPMPMRMGTADPRRKEMEQALRDAGRYAVRGATMSGKAMDFDPDALIQNLIVGMLGYHTPDGLSHL